VHDFHILHSLQAFVLGRDLTHLLGMLQRMGGKRAVPAQSELPAPIDATLRPSCARIVIYPLVPTSDPIPRDTCHEL
jgi:hypothetical protein